MNKLLTILGIGMASIALAEAPRIVDVKYDFAKQKIGITTSLLPTNTIWRVQYKDDLTSTNDWINYSNVLRGGKTNSVTLYSPAAQRYFRLKKQ